MDDDVRHVTWRLEMYAGWGARLDPAWLPSSGTEEWKKIFEAEDLAGRAFAAGGAGLPWTTLAEEAATVTGVLEQYRVQLCVAEEIAGACPDRSDEHLAALAVPAALRPPRRMHPPGPWRVCELRDGRALLLGDHPDVDLAEGAAVAHRARDAGRVVWLEPVASGAAPTDAEGVRWAEPAARPRFRRG